MTAILYLLSLGLCFTSPLSLAKRRFAQVTYTAGFMLVSLVIFSCGFIYKHHWLGIHIYFVPSMSMYPTLKPGHFILLDTWVYRDVAPQLNDVVVFQHDGEGQWLVKRLSNWPDGELQHHDLFYMLGDNRRVSLDSRSFGGIAEQQLVGKVRLVLLGIDQKHQLVVDSLLKPVQ
ncbi:MAG: S26 family signal peptidase [Chromatiaceae bacterium]|nr:S26 family signal peptidase [Chromatiaceae bacterium]